MPIASFLSHARVSTSERALDRPAALAAVADLLGQPGALEALLLREQMGSTAIGHGIAIPHGRSAALQAPRGALLRLRSAVDFNAADGQDVDLVFAMAVPDHYTHQHLVLLSELAERFSDENFRAALRNAPDAQAMRALLLDQNPPAEARA